MWAMTHDPVVDRSDRRHGGRMRKRGTSRPGWAFGIVFWTGMTVLWLTATAGVALACSPPSPEPTVTALPEGAVVLVGTTGDTVEGGRLFYVERVYAGNIPRSPVVIAFKEGEPIGDCSYPMSSGVHLVIAPNEEADGSLHADLVTLQADPASALGREFIAQAQARYGDGMVPAGVTAPVSTTTGGALRVALLVTVGAAAVGVWLLRRRRRRHSPGAS
jgi:hypothetical protein